MLKVIVYLVDVGLERGSFEFIPADASARACASLGYVSGFVDDATLARHAARSNWRPCPGPAATAIVADTCRVLQRARPARGGLRRSLTLSFVSCRPRKQYDSERPVNLPALLARLTPRQRKALPVSWIAR